VEVVHQLSAELEVEPTVFPCAAANLLGLLLEVALVVETDLHPLISLRIA